MNALNIMQLRQTGLELGKSRATLIMLSEFCPSKDLKKALDKVDEALQEAEQALEVALFKEEEG